MTPSVRQQSVAVATVTVTRLIVSARSGGLDADTASKLIVKEIDAVWLSGFNEAKRLALEAIARG